MYPLGILNGRVEKRLYRVFLLGKSVPRGSMMQNCPQACLSLAGPYNIRFMIWFTMSGKRMGFRA